MEWSCFLLAAEDSLGAKDFVGSKNASRKNPVFQTFGTDRRGSALDLLSLMWILRCL